MYMRGFFTRQPYHVPPMQTPIYYASPLPWYRGRRIQIIIIRLLIISAITFAAVWAFRLIQQLQFLYEQRTWMRYTMPADKVLLAENTPDVLLLQKTAGYHKMDLLAPSMQAAACDIPKDVAVIPWLAKSTIVFLHHLRATDNSERLVYVSLWPPQFAGLAPSFNPGHFGVQLIAFVMSPATLALGTRPTFSNRLGNSGERDLPNGTLRLFAGQPDPVDESHFTIRYELDGKPNIIDGWLMPDDTVKLEPRN